MNDEVFLPSFFTIKKWDFGHKKAREFLPNLSLIILGYKTEREKCVFDENRA